MWFAETRGRKVPCGLFFEPDLSAGEAGALVRHRSLSPKARGPPRHPGPFSGLRAGAPDQCGIPAEVPGLQKRRVTCPEPSLCGSLVKGYCTASHWEASTGPTVFLTRY